MIKPFGLGDHNARNQRSQSLEYAVPRLADRGLYLASESTFYRILKEENQLAHRRAERPRQARPTPRACTASAPNRLYSWDITYLPSAVRGCFFYLYLFLDIFTDVPSRFSR